MNEKSRRNPWGLGHDWIRLRSCLKTPLGLLFGLSTGLGVKRFSSGEMPSVLDTLSRVRDQNPSFQTAS